MGIIKATASAIRGAAADQWKEAFMAGEMGGDMLITRAQRLTNQNSANNGSGEVITDGSVIIVGEGECAVATEGGKVIGVYDQPGEQIFRSKQSGGIFSGGLGAFAKDVGRRIAFGGEITVSQRLYYINTKELTGGTIRAEGIALRFRDPVTGLDMDGGVSCYGSYTFRIADPALFYRAAIRSERERCYSDLLQQMNSEVASALQPALAKLAEEGIRPNELPQHTQALCEQLRQGMSDKWSGLRGIEVYSVALDSVRILDAAMMRQLQRDAVLKDPTMASAHLTAAKADAMQSAAANESGAGMLLAAILGKAPAEHAEWKCRCGTENKGRFCTQCGEKKPENIPQYACVKCGWQSKRRMNPPKFCPACGVSFKEK